VALFIRWHAGIHPWVGNAVKANMQETCISGNPGIIQSGYSDKPSLSIADGVHYDNVHSATVVLTVLGADVVQTDDLLRQLDVVS
jgi:hypothetical protein